MRRRRAIAVRLAQGRRFQSSTTTAPADTLEKKDDSPDHVPIDASSSKNNAETSTVSNGR